MAFLSRSLFFLISMLLALGAGQTLAESGSLEQIMVPGPSLEGNLSGDDSTRQVSVYLPPSYANSPDRRYPVLYLLHGFTDTDDNWFGMNGEHFVNVPDAMDTAWDNGAMEMIIVMPNAYSRFGGSMYSNSETTGDWEAYVVNDLVSYVDSHYRTLAKRESRGLAGHSMGGYGVLRIGMKYPDVFNSLYALSPCCMSPTMPNAGVMAEVAAIDSDAELEAAGFGVKAMLASAAAWSPNPDKPPFYLDLPMVEGEVQPAVMEKWSLNAPLSMVHQYLPALRRFAAIYFDAGNEDVGIAQTVHELDEILDDYGIDHWVQEYEGDHVNRIQERLIEHVMPMFSVTLIDQ